MQAKSEFQHSKDAPLPLQTPHSSSTASPPITPAQSAPSKVTQSPAVASRFSPPTPDKAILSIHKLPAFPASKVKVDNN